MNSKSILPRSKGESDEYLTEPEVTEPPGDLNPSGLPAVAPAAEATTEKLRAVAPDVAPVPSAPVERATALKNLPSPTSTLSTVANATADNGIAPTAAAAGAAEPAALKELHCSPVHSCRSPVPLASSSVERMSGFEVPQQDDRAPDECQGESSSNSTTSNDVAKPCITSIGDVGDRSGTPKPTPSNGSNEASLLAGEGSIEYAPATIATNSSGEPRVGSVGSEVDAQDIPDDAINNSKCQIPSGLMSAFDAEESFEMSLSNLEDRFSAAGSDLESTGGSGSALIWIEDLDGIIKSLDMTLGCLGIVTGSKALVTKGPEAEAPKAPSGDNEAVIVKGSHATTSFAFEASSKSTSERITIEDCASSVGVAGAASASISEGSTGAACNATTSQTVANEAVLEAKSTNGMEVPESVLDNAGATLASLPRDEIAPAAEAGIAVTNEAMLEVTGTNGMEGPEPVLDSAGAAPTSLLQNEIPLAAEAATSGNTVPAEESAYAPKDLSNVPTLTPKEDDIDVFNISSRDNGSTACRTGKPVDETEDKEFDWRRAAEKAMLELAFEKKWAARELEWVKEAANKKVEAAEKWAEREVAMADERAKREVAHAKELGALKLELAEERQKSELAAIEERTRRELERMEREWEKRWDARDRKCECEWPGWGLEEIWVKVKALLIAELAKRSEGLEQPREEADAALEQEQQQPAVAVATPKQHQQEQVPTAATPKQQQQQQVPTAAMPKQQQQQQVPTAATPKQQQQQQVPTAATPKQQQQQQVPTAATP
ncbi:hypothetical protein HDU96_011149, partial [Phlyctochytrium bullatum]